MTEQRTTSALEPCIVAALPNGVFSLPGPEGRAVFHPLDERTTHEVRELWRIDPMMAGVNRKVLALLCAAVVALPVRRGQAGSV